MVNTIDEIEQDIRETKNTLSLMTKGINALLVEEKEKDAYIGSVCETVPYYDYGKFNYAGRFAGRPSCFSFYFQEGLRIKLLGESAHTWDGVDDKPYIFESLNGKDDLFWFRPKKTILFIGDENIRTFFNSRPEIYLRRIAGGKPYWADETWNRDLLRRVYETAFNHVSSFSLSKKPKEDSKFFSQGRGEHLSMFDY